MRTRGWLRGLRVVQGLEEPIKDIGVVLKCHNVATTRATCMYSRAWHIQMKKMLEKKEDMRRDREALQSNTKLARSEKKRSR